MKPGRIMILTAALTATAAQAQDPAAHWRALTLMDVEAAHRMLAEDHPGAAPEVGDAAFRERLAAAHAAARKRAALVDSYEGYQAVLSGLAVGLGDKHIWSRPRFAADSLSWAGVLIARRGGSWVVAGESEAGGGAPLAGSRLVSCDGIAVDRLAEERLGGYRIVWSVEAQRIQRASWLLIDDGNPFLNRPRACLFERDGAQRTVTLNWRPIARTELAQRTSALAARGSAGLGVRKVGDGWWIALESLSERAVPVVEAVRAKAEALRAAPFVVLDMRGNGGGNSQYGQLIADALLGAPEAPARPAAGGEGRCGKVWRVSERNFRQLAYYRDTLGPRMGRETLEAFTREYDAMAAAKAKGESFTGPPRCPARAAGPSVSHAARRGRLVLLTDNSCFSSCLLVTQMFRRLGALHVGEATDANTHYMEVREDRLPSGLSLFSTLQAVAPASPAQVGPFEPEVRFEGSIADTAALERWVQALVAR
ncbi:MAG TPA: S41 family peptidase [Allosphingosinicella sp.]|jgi:hypothetical protein